MEQPDNFFVEEEQEGRDCSVSRRRPKDKGREGFLGRQRRLSSRRAPSATSLSAKLSPFQDLPSLTHQIVINDANNGSEDTLRK